MARKENMEKYKKKVKKRKIRKYSLISILSIALLIAISIIVIPNTDPNLHDITKEDIFKSQDITSRDISIFGIKLGDTPETVHRFLGKPDITTPYDPNILNIEYSESLGTEEVSLLIHFESGVITRMTIMAPFNKYLKGSTRIQYTKEDLFRKFGRPDESRLGYPFKEYDYNDLGITFIIDRNQQVGMSFYL
jgi:hypothetical protein